MPDPSIHPSFRTPGCTRHIDSSAGGLRFSGLRLGEAAALQSDDVNFLRRQLHVRRQVQRTAGCDVVTVLRALGHAKATTTLETYSHLWPSAEDRTRAAAAMLTQEVLAPAAGNLRAGTPIRRLACVTR